MSYSIPSVFNKVVGNTTVGPVARQANTPVITQKKDSFEKNNYKTVVATSAGALGGGIAGAIYAKMTEMRRSIPRAVLKKFDKDFSKYGLARAELEEQFWKDNFGPLLKSMADKLLSNEELTPEELKLAKNLDLEPNMLRFFDNAKERAKMLTELFKNNSDTGRRIMGLYTMAASMYDKYTLTSQSILSERLSSIQKNGIHYLDNQEFLDYVSSEFFKDITFKIKYDKEGLAKGIVTSLDFKKILPEGDVLSDATYTFKELVDEIISQNGVKPRFKIGLHYLSFLPSNILGSENNNIPSSGNRLNRYFNELLSPVLDKAKTANEELKNGAIKAYKNKQILKYAGIGALFAGILATCSSLIYKKVKEKKS